MTPPASRPASLATLAIHGASGPRAHGDPVVPPLVQSVNYVQEVGTEAGLLYTRYANTPNADRLQRRLALLEGAEAALVLASGMGATACALLALLRPGDHVIASTHLYGGTHRLLTEELAGLGVAVSLADPWDPPAWAAARRPETRALFLESPVNPTTRIVDLRPVAALARAHGLVLVVDSTFASPVNFRPLEHGADVVIHSATKFLNGHHDVLAGVVCGTRAYVDQVLQKQVVWGQTPDPFACWLLERGLKTLDVRVRRQNENALRLATWLEAHPAVRRVWYPGLPSHPDHPLAAAVLDGFGGMLAVELAGGALAADRLLRRLEIIQHAASLGGVDTLVSEPRFTSHARLTPDQRAAIGIPDGTLRISVGLEGADDLIADLARGLA